jgi:hypothetical protein
VLDGMQRIAGDILAGLDEEGFHVLMNGRSKRMARVVKRAVGRSGGLPNLARQLDGRAVIYLTASASFDDAERAFWPEQRHIDTLPSQSLYTEHNHSSCWELYKVDVVARPLEVAPTLASHRRETLFEARPKIRFNAGY